MNYYLAIYMSVTFSSSISNTPATNGKLWSRIASDCTGQYLVATCNTSGLWRSTNYGSTWTDLTSGNSTLHSYSWENICSNSTGQYLLAGCLTQSGGALFLSSDSGSTWTNVLNNVRFTYTTSDATGQRLAGVVFGGSIWISNNYGATWTDVGLNNTLLKNCNWYSITSSVTGQYLTACVGGGDIFSSSDYGTTWTNLTLTNSSMHNKIWYSVTSNATGQYLAAVSLFYNSVDGDIWVSNNYGSTWSNVTSGISTLHGKPWRCISSDYTGQYLVACYTDNTVNGEVYSSSNYGSTWTNISSSYTESTRHFGSITMDYSGRYLAVINTSYCILAGNNTVYNTTFDFSNPTGESGATGGSGGSGVPSSNICFPAGTPILTNQGLIPIEKINPKVHTIRKQKIVAITKSVTPDKYLVCFEKDTLGDNMPSQKTIISKNHAILYRGSMMKAKDFIGGFENVTKVSYNGEVLYNVLLETHDKMVVNNLICETLHPDHGMAILYRYLSQMNQREQQELLQKVNEYAAKTKVLISKQLK